MQQLSRHDLDLLVAALKALEVRVSDDPAWGRAPAVRVIDCVLSLNRNYDKFVVPRLMMFENGFSYCRSVGRLRELMAQADSPDTFVRVALHYRHKARADILGALTCWLADKEGEGAEGEQLARLKVWAENADPCDYKTLAIPGFGLAGFQYLRMLFGANTAKPDLRICEYVSGVVGRPVQPLASLRLLEAAASEAGVVLRDVDTTIWEATARNGGVGQSASLSLIACRRNSPTSDPLLAFSQGQIGTQHAIYALGLRDYAQLLMALGERGLHPPRLPEEVLAPMQATFVRLLREARADREASQSVIEGEEP